MSRKLWEYSCPVCSQQVESYQDDAEPAPQCANDNVAMVKDRVPSKAPGAQFNGGGWAQDLYCSVTPAYKEMQQRMKNAVSGRYRPDGKTLKSGLRGGG